MTLPLFRIRAHAEQPFGKTTIRLTMPNDRLDITLTEASARQLASALQGTFDWLDRTRRRHPKRHDELRRIVRDELTKLLSTEGNQ